MKIISKQLAKDLGLKTYFTGVACVNGHVDYRSVANSCCYQCRRDAQNKHRSLNIEKDRAHARERYANNKERAAEWKREWVKNNPEVYQARRKKYRSTTSGRAIEMINAARHSAKNKQLPFDLSVEWLVPYLERGVCELSGIEFRLAPLDGGRQNPYTASLDRIVPELGYVKSNVRVILWALNMGFNTYGEKVYAEIAKVYLEKNSTKLGLT